MLFAQTVTTATQFSPIVDEGSHLGKGYAYLMTGQYVVGPEHPPLARVLVALPLLVTGHEIPTDVNTWQLFVWPDQLFTPGIDDIDRWFLLARLPISLLTILLGSLVYRWSAALSGDWAGIVSLFILTFDPAILAFGSLVTTDLVATLFMVFTLYCLWRLAYRLTWLNVVWVGIALGLAQLSKFSALLLIPVVTVLLGLLWLVPMLNTRFGHNLFIVRYRQRSLIRYSGTLVIIFIVTGAVIWTTYRFDTISLDKLAESAGRDLVNLDEPYYSLASSVILPAPLYFKGINRVRQHAQRGHAAFLAGQHSNTGWWYYFPTAFAIKTPLPTLLLIGIGLSASLWQIRRFGLDDLFLLLPISLYVVSSMSTDINIGYRHILPLLPLLFVLAGRTVTVWGRWKWLPLITLVLCGWLIVESTTIRPNYLSYFNQLIGGPANGHHWLVDSNLDWGQDLHQLKPYMDERQLDRVKLSYFGTVSPAFYGIDYSCLPTGVFSVQTREGCPEDGSVEIEPGTYVISATHLQGVGFDDHDTFAWFRAQEPTARLGYSLFVYEVTEQDIGHENN